MGGNPFNVVIWGGGMYVTGRGIHPEYRGTIGPAIIEARRMGLVHRIGIVTTSNETSIAAVRRIKKLAVDMGVDHHGIDAATVEDAPHLNQWLDELNPMAAVVSVPDQYHYDVTLPLIERDCHCLVVKPLTLSAAHARALAEKAKEHNVIGQVEFHKRFDQSNWMLRDRIRQGEIGSPLYAVAEYSQRKMIPQQVFQKWSRHTNVFSYLGVHYADLLYWATGYRPLTVTAWGQKGILATEGINTWDAIQVVITWQGGDNIPFVSTHVTNWIDPDTTSAMSDQTISVVGTRGRIDLDQKNRGVRMVCDGSNPQDINPYFTFGHREQGSGHLQFSGYGIRSITQFFKDVSAVEEGRTTAADLQTVRASFQQGIVSTAIIEAVINSLSNGNHCCSVRLPEDLEGI